MNRELVGLTVLLTVLSAAFYLSGWSNLTVAAGSVPLAVAAYLAVEMYQSKRRSEELNHE